VVLVGGLAAWAIASPNALGCQCESPLTLALSPAGGEGIFLGGWGRRRVGENRWDYAPNFLNRNALAIATAIRSTALILPNEPAAHSLSVNFLTPSGWNHRDQSRTGTGCQLCPFRTAGVE